MFDFDIELAKRYGVFASYRSDAYPSSIEYYGENPAIEMDRLLDSYVNSESNVLDIGCGAGHTLCRIAPLVQGIYGLDSNQELLAAAQLRAEHLGLTNVTVLFGNVYDPTALQNLPTDTFDLAFSRRGPRLNQALLRTLRKEAIFIQEVVSNLDGYPLGEIFGRWLAAPYASTGDATLLHEYADLGFFPVSYKEYFYDEFFRDHEHLQAFLTQVEAMLCPWWSPRSLSRKPFDPIEDQDALNLYVRHNATTRGIRVHRQRKILVLRRTEVVE